MLQSSLLNVCITCGLSLHRACVLLTLAPDFNFKIRVFPTCFKCVRTICGVAWVVDAVFARLFVCEFVVLLWCCVWFVPFCSVVLIGLGLFWGLARVVLFCCVGVAVLFCLLVGLFVGWSVHWLVGWLRFCVLFVFVLRCCVLCWLMRLVMLSRVVLLLGFGVAWFGLGVCFGSKWCGVKCL